MVPGAIDVPQALTQPVAARCSITTSARRARRRPRSSNGPRCCSGTCSSTSRPRPSSTPARPPPRPSSVPGWTVTSPNAGPEER
jgi:hypothetical protein